MGIKQSLSSIKSEKNSYIYRKANKLFGGIYEFFLLFLTSSGKSPASVSGGKALPVSAGVGAPTEKPHYQLAHGWRDNVLPIFITNIPA